MQLMEQNINELLEQLGGMEKVRTTPLPLVYVTQLRTVLLLYLLTLVSTNETPLFIHSHILIFKSHSYGLITGAGQQYW